MGSLFAFMVIMLRALLIGIIGFGLSAGCLLEEPDYTRTELDCSEPPHECPDNMVCGEEDFCVSAAEAGLSAEDGQTFPQAGHVRSPQHDDSENSQANPDLH